MQGSVRTERRVSPAVLSVTLLMSASVCLAVAGLERKAEMQAAGIADAMIAAALHARSGSGPGPAAGTGPVSVKVSDGTVTVTASALPSRLCHALSGRLENALETAFPDLSVTVGHEGGIQEFPFTECPYGGDVTVMLAAAPGSGGDTVPDA